MTRSRAGQENKTRPTLAVGRRPHGLHYHVGYEHQVTHQSPGHQHTDASLLVDIIQPAVIQNQRNQPGAYVGKKKTATDTWNPVRSGNSPEGFTNVK